MTKTTDHPIVRIWEWCDQAGKPSSRIFSEIVESISAAHILGLTNISLTTRRTDHFMHGGNVSKGECVTFRLEARPGKPQIELVES